MTSSEPRAVHDVLAIVNRMQTLDFNVAPAEVHCFAYLACAAWVSEDRSRGDWGYEFAALDSTRPFSIALDTAIRQSLGAALVVRQREVLIMTDQGRQVALGLTGTLADDGRGAYVSAACDVSAAISIPTALSALAMEPQLQRSAVLRSDRALFDSEGRRLIVEELAQLDASLPEGTGLLGRMVLWVSYWSVLRSREDTALVVS